MGLRARCWILIAAVLAVIGGQVAHAEDPAVDLAVAVEVRADGTLLITETYTGDPLPAQLRRELPRERAIDSSYFYTYDVTGIAATADGAQADVSTEGRAAVTGVAIETGGADEVQLTYSVGGATRSEQGEEGDLTVVEWPVLAGLSAPVGQLTAEVNAPGSPQLLDCAAGPEGSVAKCALVAGGTFEQPNATFQDGPREAGDIVVVTVAYPASTVAATADVGERWSLDRAFEASRPAALWALLAAALGGGLLYLLHRRAGRDERNDGAIAAVGAFTPVGQGESVFTVPDGVRPGHVGTVADEHVDPIDITATLVDLAVRGHLRIVELPHSLHGLIDWQLVPLEGSGELAPFERELLAALAPSTLVSGLRAKLADHLPVVQEALYDDVVARGWFASRPDSTRSSWRSRGYLGLAAAVVVAGALIAFTNLGLLALVLLALGSALVWIAERMPRRTAAGSALLGGLQALSSLLATHPTDQMPAGRELTEISKLLGYTVVLGGKERWLAALVEADETVGVADPRALDWYHAPDTWHLQDLPASLTQFVTVVQGELFAR